MALQELPLPVVHLAQAGGEKERCSSSPVGFHMVAELPGAATVEAMSRPEQKETEKVFEEARGEAPSRNLECRRTAMGNLGRKKYPYSGSNRVRGVRRRETA